MSGCLIGNTANVPEFYFGTKARLSAQESGPLGDGPQSTWYGPYFGGRGLQRLWVDAGKWLKRDHV